jgi:flagellin-specific chaperone FliS
MDSRGATSFMPEERRPYSVGEFDMNMPKLSRNTEFIHISDQELEQFDLPNWSTTCLLIDLYYRYVYPSRPFLAPKHRLIYQLQVRQDASLLHAMFSSSCRFASSIVMPNANLRDPQHWYFLAEKYWDLMELDTALQALVLLMGSLGPGGYVQQSIEGSERTFSLMKVTNTLESHNIRDWNSFAQIATKRQVVKHEDMLRTIWSSWKLNVFIRMNRGSPFHQLSTNLLQFPSDLPLPLSDSQYNSNMYMFDVTDNHGLAKLSYRRWKDLKLDLLEAANSSAGFKSFSDSDLTIIAIKHMEDIMDTISSGFLNSESVNRFNQSIKVTDNIINSSLYQISHIKKKMAIVNISKLFALLVNALCKIVINVTQCHKILLIKPHETHSNSNPDDVFNSLYESKLEDIHQACLSISPEQLQHFITAFTAALDVVRLIELGMGKIPEAATSAVPIQVIGGPANLSPASEISSLKTSESWWISAIQEPGKSMSAQVQTYNEYPDIWLQYPIFSVVIVANALTVMASAVVLTKMMTLREVESMDSGSGSTNVEWIVGNRQHVVPTMMDQTTLDVVKRSFNVIEIHESISLCSKYINVHGRFWPYVESVSYQVEAIMNYIDDIVMKS